MTSLRRTALLWLAGLLLAIGATTALASYLLVAEESNGFLDTQLRQIAWYIGDTPNGAIHPAPTDPAHDPEDDFMIRIRDANGATIRGSDSDIAIPWQAATGFSNADAGSEAWRTFTLVTPERSVQISQRMTVRDELATDAALRSAVPILVLIPLSWLLLSLVIDRVMRRLDGLAAGVAARDAADHSPVPLDGVPAEVAPLVRSMNALLARLREALERQRRFVSDAAHELRTPLAALMLQIENLRGVARGQELLARLADAEAGARRAAALVSQLLRLARFDADTADRVSEPVDLAAVLADCVDAIAPLAKRAAITISLDAQARLVIPGHAPDLHILVANLLDNAVRYTPAGGNIDIRSAREPGGGAISIRDTGPGIPEHLLGRVFERFFRAAPQDIEGSGLGLAIARSIAQRHGLALTLENRQGRSGLVVRLTVPPTGLSQP